MSMLRYSVWLWRSGQFWFSCFSFRALDKVLELRSAVAQAQKAVPNRAVATALIIVGLFVEVVMSAGVASGIADRACALVLAGYCAVTALVWKRSGAPATFGVQAKARRAR